jgi:hypothetical protein
MYLGGWLKLLGFGINILSSVYLILRVLRGEFEHSIGEYLRREIIWGKVWRDMKLTSTSIKDRDVVITSFLVVIGSSLQMTGDLLDP